MHGLKESPCLVIMKWPMAMSMANLTTPQLLEMNSLPSGSRPMETGLLDVVKTGVQPEDTFIRQMIYLAPINQLTIGNTMMLTIIGNRQIVDSVFGAKVRMYIMDFLLKNEH